jgi:hypothetical protein
MRRLLATMIALVAMLLFMPQEVSATADVAVDTASISLEPLAATVTVDAVTAVTHSELIFAVSTAPVAVHSERTDGLGANSAIRSAENPHYALGRYILLDHRHMLRAQSGRTAAGVRS